jgi:hypothetical protein
MRPISWKGQFLNAGGFTDMISTPKYAWIFLVLLCSRYLFCCTACSIQPLHEILVSPISYTCPVRCISRPYITHDNIFMKRTTHLGRSGCRLCATTGDEHGQDTAWFINDHSHLNINQRRRNERDDDPWASFC